MKGKILFLVFGLIAGIILGYLGSLFFNFGDLKSVVNKEVVETDENVNDSDTPSSANLSFEYNENLETVVKVSETYAVGDYNFNFVYGRTPYPVVNFIDLTATDGGRTGWLSEYQIYMSKNMEIPLITLYIGDAEISEPDAKSNLSGMETNIKLAENETVRVYYKTLRSYCSESGSASTDCDERFVKLYDKDVARILESFELL